MSANDCVRTRLYYALSALLPAHFCLPRRTRFWVYICSQVGFPCRARQSVVPITKVRAALRVRLVLLLTTVLAMVNMWAFVQVVPQMSQSRKFYSPILQSTTMLCPTLAGNLYSDAAMVTSSTRKFIQKDFTDLVLLVFKSSTY